MGDRLRVAGQADLRQEVRVDREGFARAGPYRCLKGDRAAADHCPSRDQGLARFRG